MGCGLWEWWFLSIFMLLSFFDFRSCMKCIWELHFHGSDFSFRHFGMEHGKESRLVEEKKSWVIDLSTSLNSFSVCREGGEER